jgi:hypothetical protein
LLLFFFFFAVWPGTRTLREEELDTVHASQDFNIPPLHASPNPSPLRKRQKHVFFLESLFVLFFFYILPWLLHPFFYEDSLETNVWGPNLYEDAVRYSICVRFSSDRIGEGEEKQRDLLFSPSFPIHLHLVISLKISLPFCFIGLLFLLSQPISI